MKSSKFLGVLLFTIAGVGSLVSLSCKKDNNTVDAASITAISCSSVSFSSTATAGTAYSATATVPYAGGNGKT
jgi:hypothetical protein